MASYTQKPGHRSVGRGGGDPDIGAAAGAFGAAEVQVRIYTLSRHDFSNFWGAVCGKQHRRESSAFLLLDGRPTTRQKKKKISV